MRKADVVETLSQIEGILETLKDEIKRISSTHISRKEEKEVTKQLCSRWFEEIEPSLQRFGVVDEVRERYNSLFTTLLKLAFKNSRAGTYLGTLDSILLSFNEDLHVPVMKSAGSIVSVAHIDKILDGVTQDEKDYLEEALGCANHNYIRAAVVLGWNATIHRVHKVIETLGFDVFNKKSEEMKILTQGRFKRFNKSFHVQSLSDFSATVFDNDLLWVLEFWKLIDSNQHERLSLGFTMRNNSAHPGEASITEENLVSFYSDLRSIIFENPKFRL